MRHALAAGADLINDIWGFRMPGAIEAVRDSQCGLCVMHMLGEPQTMQLAEPAYQDVVGEVRGFLEQRVTALMQAGIAKRRISIDPGFGFGKAVIEHNYALLAALAGRGPARRASVLRAVSHSGGHVAQVNARRGHGQGGARAAGREHRRGGVRRRARRCHPARA